MSVEKIFVGNFWSVGKFIVNKFIDDFIDGTYMQKKITPLHFIGHSLDTI